MKLLCWRHTHTHTLAHTAFVARCLILLSPSKYSIGKLKSEHVGRHNAKWYVHYVEWLKRRKRKSKIVDNRLGRLYQISYFFSPPPLFNTNSELSERAFGIQRVYSIHWYTVGRSPASTILNEILIRENIINRSFNAHMAFGDDDYISEHRTWPNALKARNVSFGRGKRNTLEFAMDAVAGKCSAWEMNVWHVCEVCWLTLPMLQM